MRTLNFYNSFHLGDCIFNINYLNRLLNKNDVEKVNFYITENYIPQIEEFVIDKEKIAVFPLQSRPADAINLWIGREDFVFRHKDRYLYDIMYVDFWHYVSSSIGLINPICSKFENLIAMESKTNNVPGFDVLLINSQPCSGQAKYDHRAYQELAGYLTDRSLKVCCTSPLGEAYCTMEDKLSVYDIGLISMSCSYVIGIHTGPFIPTLNEYTLKNVKKYIIYDEGNHFTYDKYIRCYSNEELVKKVREYL